MSSGEIEFFELPQGTPSVSAVSTGTGYCTASDVCSLAKAVTLGVGDNPTLQDVQGYILMTAGQIDGVLVNRGFEVPVNTASFPEAQGLLCWVNATGAAAMLQESAPIAPNVDRAQKAYAAAMQMLADAKFSLDIPSDQERAKVRAPWLTYTPPTGLYDPTLDQIGGTSGDGISGGVPGMNRRLPYFGRGMRF